MKLVLPQTLADLEPVEARLCLRVQHTLEHLGVARGGLCLVAFSGGADSTALAVVLRCLGLRLHLAHLDHGLRAESRREAEAARAFAEALGVGCTVQRAEVGALAREAGSGLEEAGREARYAFLEATRQTVGATWIAVAHHADDLAEDVLLRLIRGTGWPGLGGMKACDPVRHLVRPFLELPKQTLLSFLQRLGIPWIEDASNAGLAFRRNRVRNQILPLLTAENPSLVRSITTLHQLAEDDEQFWALQLKPLLQEVQSTEQGLFLRRALVLAQPRALRLRLYTALIRLCGQGQARAETLFQLDTACTGSRAAKVFPLPGGIQIRTDQTGIYVRIRTASDRNPR